MEARETMSSTDPDLLSVLADPSWVSEVPAESVPSLMAHCAAIQSALAARLAATRTENDDGKPLDRESAQMELLTVAEVAKLLGVPKGYVYDLTRRGELSSVKFGKYVRVEFRVVQEWIEQHREKGLKDVSTSRRLRRHDRN